MVEPGDSARAILLQLVLAPIAQVVGLGAVVRDHHDKVTVVPAIRGQKAGRFAPYKCDGC